MPPILPPGPRQHPPTLFHGGRVTAIWANYEMNLTPGEELLELASPIAVVVICPDTCSSFSSTARHKSSRLPGRKVGGVSLKVIGFLLASLQGHAKTRRRKGQTQSSKIGRALRHDTGSVPGWKVTKICDSVVRLIPTLTTLCVSQSPGPLTKHGKMKSWKKREEKATGKLKRKGISSGSRRNWQAANRPRPRSRSLTCLHPACSMVNIGTAGTCASNPHFGPFR